MFTSFLCIFLKNCATKRPVVNMHRMRENKASVIVGCKEPSEVGLFSFPVDYTSFCMEGMFKEPLFKDPWRKDTAMW